MWFYKRKETRIHPKTDEPVIVELVGKDFNGQMIYAKDISVGGICVATPSYFRGCDIDEEIEMNIQLPGEKAFRVLAIIRHTELDDSYFGAVFIEMDKESKAKLAQYIAKMGSYEE
ncbi:MAG: hypothetical protein A2504_15495 [Bdellovibrionales bacterium RIFOXYD12_FULL_39_22]|nr:MAG: hypothetical protein A2385_02925 [Bdellovibrionales bacterium RIFOXYB1_FULL_39_21]OFZ43198.1 MAG: hypothetical protein A2485_12070 [Bdellovibrionales bacterium RIFOXYC12_FULL_39_17]OFZ47936.1 MAG: hypothetical protein A2404_16710 [Bdellovibrionales bacterium RIFOXYC1_FULL_39_130]OFZ74854.1 MAG: hypothetical protein A2451_03250 [Bdellovibrionales bacterium RIFOXYC2_FULL_39_8]OFZ75716.1 MAG: hypothetical protein A2560_13210 [Bdellovibrionales bacterium RIFOXYD1_FULL_39_84]OFZ94206.1 MAG: